MFSTPTVNEVPWLIRADFTDPDGWQDIRRALGADRTGHDDRDEAQIDFGVVDDRDFDGLTAAGLLGLEPYAGGQYLLVDRATVAHPEHPVLAVDVGTGRSFRLIPGCVPGFAVDMLLGNMDFDDVADGVDADGVFHGFVPGVGDETPESAGATAPVGSLQDVVDEADPAHPDSFIGELIRTGFWNPAAWRRLEAGMREACRVYDGAGEVPRDLTAAFHSVMVRVPNLVALPGFIPLDPGAVEDRLDRIRVLSSWFLRGWTPNRPDGPLPGEHDPHASHG